MVFSAPRQYHWQGTVVLGTVSRLWINAAFHPDTHVMRCPAEDQPYKVLILQQ
jgi:hypothetical protein